MKYFLGLLLIASLITVTRAQQPGPAANGSQKPAAPASDFQAQVQKELAQFTHGAELYRRCDVFARKVNDVAAQKLGIAMGKNGSSTMLQRAPLDVEQDTSLVADISHTSNDEDEPSIAINRKNPKLIVAGANDQAMTTSSMPAYLSTDAGMSWKTYRLPLVNDSGSGALGDPMIISDDSGMFYYAFLVDEPTLSGVSDLMVAHSPDGETWTLGSPVVGNTDMTGALLEDKETIAIDNDPGSPTHGRLYIAWTEYDQNSSSATHFLAYSDDKGDNWSIPQVYTETYGYFALLRVGKGGTVFIASSSGNQQDATNTHGMVVSQDGGASFMEYAITDFTDYPAVQSGYNGLKGNGFRAFPYVCFDVDRSNNMLYGVYGSYDDSFGNAILFEATSNDLGQTWSNLQQIGTPNLLGEDHFMPWVSFDPISKHAYISLYSSEEDTVQNVKTRAVRCDFATPEQMEDVGHDLFDPLLNTSGGWNFIGDYTGSDAYAGNFAATWTENRQPRYHDGDIFAYVSSPLSSGSGVTRQINAQELEISNASPNPVSGGSVSFVISSSVQSPASIRVFDLRGIVVLTEQPMMDPSAENVVTLDIHSLAAGVYRAQISCGRQVAEQNFVVLR